MLEQLSFTRDRAFVRLLTIDRGVRDYLLSHGPGAEMTETESRAQRPTIEQIEDRISLVKQLREQFKGDKGYLQTLDFDLYCLQMTLNWRRREQRAKL
jgi:hypothetical protein